MSDWANTYPADWLIYLSMESLIVFHLIQNWEMGSATFFVCNMSMKYLFGKNLISILETKSQDFIKIKDDKF